MEGQTIGRYTVLRKIGSGGMAEVFLARFAGAQGAEKLLVIKKIHPAFASNARFIGMFVDEAKVAMRLNHSNIVQVYAFEQIGDDHILSMEHVDGSDLHEIRGAVWAAGGRVPFGLAAFIAGEIAKGLDYAHSRRDDRGRPLDIVHRDVSPQNVLISRDGAVKIADFGIARARLVHEESLGEVKGKLGYMAPEQAKGLPVDRRADVFSLGVILHELLVGRPLVPIRAAADEVLAMVRDGRHPGPGDLDPSVPAELDAVVRRALAVDPAGRYATAREMALDLGRYLHFGDAIFDSHALEAWMAQNVPRGILEAAAAEAETTAGTTASMRAPGRGGGDADRPAALGEEERRAVVLVAVRVAIEPRPARAGVSAELVRLADEIAFKAEGVLHEVAGGLRIYLGLAHSSVEDSIRGVRLGYDLLDVAQTLSQDHRMRVEAAVAVTRGWARARGGQGGEALSFEPGEELLAHSARVLDDTPFGEITASGDVFRLARGEYNFAPAPAAGAGAPGEGGEQRAYRARGARSRFERVAEIEVRGAFRGRGAELARLEEAWRRARAGRSVLVKIVGELGIGKTRLALRFAERAVDAGADGGERPAFVRAECLFAERDTPLAGAAAAVRAVAGLMDGDPESDLWRALDPLLGGAPAYLARQVRFLTTVLAAPDVAFARAAGRQRDLVRRLAFGLGVLLGLSSRGRGAVVVVENAHWLDAQSVDVLSELAGLRAPQKVLCLLVGQPSTLAGRRIAGLEVLELAELPDDEVRALVVEQLGDGGEMTAVVDQIVAGAQGNPFFANEIVDSLLERGILAPVTAAGAESGPRFRPSRPGAIRLPTTMEGLAAGHIDDLEPQLRTALRAAAVIGARFSPEKLGALVGHDVGEALRALTGRGFLIQAKGTGGVDEYRFRKPMVREAAYAGLAATDRRRLHRMISDDLIAAAERDAGAVPAAHVAWHLENAGDPERAGAYYLEAGDAALRIYSNRQALRLFDRALAALPQGSAARFRALERRQKVLRDLGDHPARHAVVAEMERIAAGLGDPSGEALAINSRAQLLFDEGEFGAAAREVRRALEVGSRASDLQRIGESLRLLAYIAAEAGHLDRALDCCDWALRLASGEADLAARHLEARILGIKGLVLMMRGDLLLSPAFLARALVLFRHLGKRRNESLAMSNLALSAQARGDLPEAEELLGRAIRMDRENRDVSARGRKLAALGAIHVEAGDFDEGRAALEEGRRICRENTEPVGEVEADLGLACLWLERGDPDGAGEILAEVARRGFAERSRVLLTRLHQLRTRACLALGDVGGALEAAAAGARLAFAAGMTGEMIHGAALRGLALGAAGRHEEALAACDRLEELIAARGGVRRAEEVWWMRARVLFGAGDREGAQQALGRALEEVERKGDLILKPAKRAAYNAHPLVQEILVGLPV